MKLTINEIFYSLQGEGKYTGYPFLFIRFAKCNLRCRFCDTEYSFEQGTEIDIKDIIKEIEKYTNIPHILLTGGEPLIQKEGLLILIDKLIQIRKKVVLETNGTYDLSEIPKKVRKVIDMKTPGSGHGDSFLISNLNYFFPKDEMKFIILDRKDFDYSLNFVKNNGLIGRNILFSPVFGQLSPKTLSQWILAERLPIKLNLQIHKVVGIK